MDFDANLTWRTFFTVFCNIIIGLGGYFAIKHSEMALFLGYLIMVTFVTFSVSAFFTDGRISFLEKEITRLKRKNNKKSKECRVLAEIIEYCILDNNLSFDYTLEQIVSKQEEKRNLNNKEIKSREIREIYEKYR